MAHSETGYKEFESSKYIIGSFPAFCLARKFLDYQDKICTSGNIIIYDGDGTTTILHKTLNGNIDGGTY